MYARVTFVQTPLDKVDEAISIMRDHVVPASEQEKGFHGFYALADRETGKGISIFLWETEADMIAAESSGFYLQQLARFKGVFSAPPVRELYEVSVKP
ncbi:MAG: hypothetical protein RBT75_15075 [Anaerolineae bacterium]|jgi:heme-degrading monooxygenase HmoA|nr:hypothetical protein [Anaerolineae bacterium]